MALNVYYLFGLFQTVTQSATIVANLLTIIAFANIRSLQTHTSNLLIYALSVTDFIWGIFQLLFYGVTYIYRYGPPGGEIGCMISVPFEYIYNAGNVLLVAISIDRVLLVTLDYSKYVKVTTKRRLKVIIAVCYLICLVGAAFELGLWNVAKDSIEAELDYTHGCPFPARRMKFIGLFVSLFYFFLPLLLISIFSVIFINRLVARTRKNRQIGSNISNQSVATINNSQESDGPATDNTNDENQHGNAASRKRYVKAAVTLAALVSAMCISMFPFSMYLFIIAPSGRDSTPVMLTFWYVLQLNPLLDPLFYAATQKDIKEFYGTKIKNLIRGCQSTS